MGIHPPLRGPKSESVTAEGQPDGWTPTPGFLRDIGPRGETQLVVSVPIEHLAQLHRELAAILAPPVGVLYRQVVDRRAPRSQGAPPRDFVALEVKPELVAAALEFYGDLIYHDARCELWLRGRLGDQVVLDADGVMYLSPDDPAFEDALRANGLADDLTVSILDRDYAKHNFHAQCDALEDGLITELGMTEVTHSAARGR